MREVVRGQFTRLRGSTTGWAIGLAAYGAMMVSFYPFVRDQPDLEAYYDSFPEAIKELFGGLEALTSVEGFLGAEYFSLLPLLLAVLTVAKAADMLAGEEARGTMDIVLAQPVARNHLVAGRFSALAVATALASGVGGLAVALVGLFVGAGEHALGLVVWGLLATLPALVFGAIALLTAAIARRKRTAVVAGTIATVGSWVWASLAPLAPALDGLEVLSPYHHFDVSKPLSSGIHWGSTGVLVGLVIVLVAAAMIAYERKDVGV